jgi:FixJ family two-component response regulator
VRAAAFDFVAKPYQMQRLLEIIDRALEDSVSEP